MADRTTAIAIFDDRTQAQRAIEQLKRAGFTEKEIGVTARDTGEVDGDVVDRGKGTHAKEGAIAGVAAGAGVGALWGLGILAGVLPGIGTAIAGGTLAAILSSAAAGAAAAGLAGTLIGLGIPEEEAKYYDREFQAGRVLVTVGAGRRVQEAQAILIAERRLRDGFYVRAPAKRRGPSRHAVRSRNPRRRGAHARGPRRGIADPQATRYDRRGGGAQGGPYRATFRRRARAKGRLVIERHAVSRQPASGPVGGNETVRIPLSEEQVEVEKKPVVTERVTVGKRTTEEEQRVEATLAKENVKVEKRGRDTRPNQR